MTTEAQTSSNSPDDEMDVDPVVQNGEEDNCEPDESGGWRVSEDIYIPPPPVVFGEYDSSGPRLMLVKIVAKNFKSYAGTVEIGPFHKCFSAGVGPNGNGKSNAVDAMLFVFGYRANKIRTKKVAELIHNSNEHPNCSSCSVSIHFQQIIDKPGQDYDIVPNSEFVISRTCFRDSNSYYEIDGKRVQFKKISQLLRSHHVDLDHNRFLILQGEVEQIALMKPKGQADGDTGMLEFLEDIIGTRRYKEPLAKLSEKVEFLSEDREEKLRRLKVVEKARLELEKPMQDAVQYLKIENSITKLHHKYYQVKKHEVTKDLAVAEEDKKEFDEVHTKLIDEMKKLQNEREEKVKEFKEKSKKWDKLQQQKDTLTNKFDEIRKKDEALHAESVATNKRRKDNIVTVKSEKTKLEDLQRIPAKNQKDIQECEKLQEKHLADHEKEEAALVSLMSGLKEKTEPLMKKRSKLEKELASHRKFVDETKSVFDIAKSKLDLYTSEEQREKNKLEQLKEQVKESSERLATCKQKMAVIEPKIPATEKSLQGARSELEALKIKEGERNIQLRNTRLKFDEQKSAMQAGRSRNQCLNALMQEKRKGRFSGIYGRLGDLGAIDAKYDVAISTACGPLDNIVVDTVNTATECIRFLRENDIGRASFIALEKQERFARQSQEKIRTPENVPRLFDLIKVEDRRILPAFYFALQNTLVADEIEQATRITYGAQRFRVVTLKGELFELSGTMSGGGRTVARGRMGQKVARSEPSAQDIAKLQEELDKVYEEYNDAKAKQVPLENQIQTLNTALKEMLSDRDRLKVTISQISIEEPNLRAQLKEQEKKAKTTVCDPKKFKELEKVVKEAELKYQETIDNSKETDDEVTKINKEIEEISGSRVKEQQKKISGLKKNIDKTKGEICRLQVAIKTAERNTMKAEQRIETLEEEIKNCEQRIRAIQKEKSECEEVAKGVLDELKQVDEDLAERDEVIGEQKAELEKLKTKESEMKAAKIDLDQKASEKYKIVKGLKHQIPELVRSLGVLKLQEIPNEEEDKFKEYNNEEMDEMDSKNIAAALHKAKEKLPKEIPNMQIIEQYKAQNNEYIKRSEKLQKITEERNSMRDTYQLAVRKRMQEFNAGFTLITGKLKEMYRMITLGGDAELELVDSLDPFSEGIVFSVRPPKKSWKYIQNLSGGEKTLSSLALVFALHHYKPTPVYFMDEIDAALDFKNVSIVASYIKERTKNAQFIVISHRSDMFELADYLVGIYKIYNCSKCAVLDVKKFNAKVGITEQSYQNQHCTKPQFFSQPNPLPTTSSTISEAKQERVHKKIIPSTCPVMVNGNTQHEDDSNRENDANRDNDNESGFDLRLGDISLPATPMKPPPPPSGKKRKAEETETPKRERNVRRNVEKDLQEVAEALQKTPTSPSNSSYEDYSQSPRRTSRIRKIKTPQDFPSPPPPSGRKRRKS